MGTVTDAAKTTQEPEEEFNEAAYYQMYDPVEGCFRPIRDIVADGNERKKEARNQEAWEASPESQCEGEEIEDAIAKGLAWDWENGGFHEPKEGEEPYPGWPPPWLK